MSGEEIAAFLAGQRVAACATHGPRGWPHVMPLWYVVRQGRLWAWTYAKSQKVRNLERDPRTTLQVEAGEEYHELRGVTIEAHAELHREVEVVAAVGREIFERHGREATSDELLEVVRAQAAKRVAMEFVPVRVTSWDHRKLGGVY